MSDRRTASAPGHTLAGHLDIEMLGAFLTHHGVEYEIVEHDRAMRALEAARAADVPAEAAAKAVVLFDRGALSLAVLPASEMLDLHKLRHLLGASKSLRLASEEEIAAHLPEFELGAVPPVGGGLFAARIVDRRLLDQPRVLCGGPDHRHGLLLDPREMVRLGDAMVADICEE